ncbi:MAG: hypothetical protein K8R52_04315, partial [Bacteroidales bacterium]|nr:hypothetical protein [Bacteroidales bacterium]
MADSLGLDSLYVALPDSLTVLDSLLSDTLVSPQDTGGDIDAEVEYNATDSLIFSLDGGTVELYGNAHINYEEITLEADYIR